METLLKNVSSTAELLAVSARSGALEQWDGHALSRAFHWARYGEHLFRRFHSDPAVRTAMEKQLQLTNQSLRAALPGYTDVSFCDLSRCQHLLLVGLLNNPELPVSIMRILFGSGSPADTEHSEYVDVTGLCSHIIQCKSACKVLSPLADSSAVGADAEVQGAMLMERLGALMGRGREARRAEHFLDSLLQGCDGASEHFCLVIAAALLTAKNSAAEGAAQDVLQDWLQKTPGVLKLTCSALSASLLAGLAKEHRKFREAYCGVLKTWASDMEYSVHEGEWVQTSTKTCTVTFQKLTEHFLALFETCPTQRDDVERELNALKLSDGDFDVRGLSVWGDLLSALNT
ncbi:putative Fanconi anemia group F protein [Scophthalmus maximus]|uniref:Putative Fanconi anemia group F protein n=1 Tax=Scophthalmus maximus TaxID=52904 RepID=A0A2U9BX87_SCOMX|nr:putative Fanconi anemia group F protein [Scophthalmus maximus]